MRKWTTKRKRSIDNFNKQLEEEKIKHISGNNISKVDLDSDQTGSLTEHINFENQGPKTRSVSTETQEFDFMFKSPTEQPFTEAYFSSDANQVRNPPNVSLNFLDFQNSVQLV